MPQVYNYYSTRELITNFDRCAGHRVWTVSAGITLGAKSQRLGASGTEFRATI